MESSRYELRGQLGLSLWSAILLLYSSGCGMSSPKGFLGVKWGDDVRAAASHLGLSCETWEPWEGGSGYEACFDIDHPVDAFGRRAYVRFFRSRDGLEGLSLRFTQCGATRDDLAVAVRQAFSLKEAGAAVYEIFHDGGAVRLDYDNGDDTCELTLAGPRFGKAFANYVLQEGFKNLSHGLRPH
jgi:hypothetical protein